MYLRFYSLVSVYVIYNTDYWNNIYPKHSADLCKCLLYTTNT